MLSFGRETAPEYVINAVPGKYEISMGHTGTSIKEYLTLGAKYARKAGVLVEMEADHLTVTTSSAQAVKRISGVKEYVEIGDEDIERALKYIFSEVDEAAQTGYVNFFTIDACELIDYSVERLSGEDLKKRFRDVFGNNKEKILSRYINKRHLFIGSSGKSFRLVFSEEEVMRLALKYYRSLITTVRIYDYLEHRIRWPFGIEIAFDETPVITEEKDLLFYLRELWELNVPVDYIAPNIGFEKKQDYRGDLKVLKKRIERLAAIARTFGALLSFHSGSGSTPWSGKGRGVYDVVKEATSRDLKYKVSGIYFELLLELMAWQSTGSRPRKLYEEVYDAVIDYVRREVKTRGPLYSEVMERQLKEYEENIEKTQDPYNPLADIFRYYSFIALNLRDRSGDRPYRRAIIELYEEDEAFRNLVDREVADLTLRLIDGLGFANNVDKIE